MKGYKRGRNESWDDYAWRMIEERQENGLEYDELYEILYEDQISNTEARKRLYGVKANIIRRNELDNNIPESYLEKESFELKSDGSHELNKFVEACEEDMKSPEKIMEMLGYDYLQWELVSSRHNRWNVYSKRDGKQLLYSIRAVVKPRKVELSTDKIEEIINGLTLKLKHVKAPDYDKNGEYMLEIPMMDVHFNKFAEARLVGSDSSAEETASHFLSVIKNFIKRSTFGNRKFSKVIFPIGQDFFNTDNKLNTTTRGTPQNNDLAHDEMFEKGVDLLYNAIEMCREVAPVFVPFVAGNHDENISYYACSSLKRAYKCGGVKDVEFDIIPKRKYIEFGNCLIGYTHGNKERNRLEKQNIMAVEQPEAWGRTKFREWHLGHEHHEDVKGIGGSKYRKINSITATDEWHYESGWVGALRMAQAFVWHKEYGLLDIMNCPII